MKQALLSDLFYLAGPDTERPCLSTTTFCKANSSLACLSAVLTAKPGTVTRIARWLWAESWKRDDGLLARTWNGRALNASVAELYHA